ncbi:CubicO group peptidase (beta-lactamase class C family) [Conyzicola lurida]|uniref:CubicO group peptidase (Beta-lactamase class C family) n=1 Tax=Conyzicola lurida TaxID=1172621 RepID=A0A841AP20_9MICO|nr:serine hydrolase [Conyzicola lurida]MBB5843702.1 CubicO group peptidase (beta-lactamase class C family) [Conyzicola lurida]
MTSFPRSTPEAQGVSSAAIGRFVDALEREVHDLHSLMLVRHGHVIAEGWWAPYSAAAPHALFSISKSFVSTAVGFAIEEGLLALDDRVVDLLPDDLPEAVGDNLAAMRLRHLLTMTTGHAVDTIGRVDESQHNWSRALLALPVELAPGSTFVYNTGATYLISAILQRLTGQRVLDYLTPRLFEPLGIADAAWEQCPRGIDVGGWGLSVTTEDIARFGQTYLRGGEWQGTQVVPAHWVAEATARQVPNATPDAPADNDQGYGYQFWRNRHGSYRADGAFGQLSIAFPEQDALLVLTSGVQSAQIELDLVWEHLLPVLGNHEILTPDAAADAALTARLRGLTIPAPPGAATSPAAIRVSGREYSLPTNSFGLTTVALTENLDGTTLALTTATGVHELRCGYGVWEPAESALVERPQPVAAAGAWVDDSAYLAKICLTGTPFALTVSLDFRADEVTVNIEQNVSFGPTQLLHTNGSAA